MFAGRPSNRRRATPNLSPWSSSWARASMPRGLSRAGLQGRHHPASLPNGARRPPTASPSSRRSASPAASTPMPACRASCGPPIGRSKPRSSASTCSSSRISRVSRAGTSRRRLLNFLEAAGGAPHAERIETVPNDDALTKFAHEIPESADSSFVFLHQRVNHTPYTSNCAPAPDGLYIFDADDGLDRRSAARGLR